MGVATEQGNNPRNSNKDLMPEKSTKKKIILVRKSNCLSFRLAARSNREKGLFLCAPLSRLTETPE